MMKNKAGWVALIVLAVASLLMIFFVMPNINDSKDAVTAQKPAQDEAKPADTAADSKGARPSVADDAMKQAETLANIAPETAADTKPIDTKPADTKPAGLTSADPAAAWTVPGFDILRVEPDGSTVIAGKAQPNTKIEIVNGETVVGTADVGATGDFAAIFDKPLPAGDYQLTLRSVGENGATKSSEEVATVSIPKDAAGKLLAMVSKPGEASRIITKPVVEATARAKTDPKPAETEVAKQTVAKQTPATGDLAVVMPAVPATGKTSAVGVSAVEIEGRKIFVAGNAKAGALVRIYAGDTLVGETKADAQGRFVVDGTIDLPVGNHTIRADVMSADGQKVELRAAVPFDRPAGNQVAAVAQGTVVTFDGGSFDGLRMEAGKAFGLLKGSFAGGKMPTAEELAAARSATEIALRSLSDFRVADNLDPSVKEMAAKTAKAAKDALAVLKSLPQDAPSISASLGKIEAAVGSALMPRTDGTGGTAVASGMTTMPAGDTAATGSALVTPGDVANPATSPETVQQAPLTQSKSSVIIRRGDTLWQISRRVYGAGVRYTTIYLANEDQITDPNRILPGQIFGVPDTAMSETESEEIHRKRVKHLP